jgi:osmotically-inducible protein OsmY
MKTDAQLQSDVMAELQWEPSVHATEIGVTVKDGVVTLGGHVASFVEKHDAERAAQRVSGTRAVAVEIDVKLPALGKRGDADIARAAENVLEWLCGGDKPTVKVMVESGWITLSGEVEWQFQKQAATDAVRHLMGVVGVSNQIALTPAISFGSVQTDIENALRRLAKTDAAGVSVSLKGSDITLSGKVASWAERNAARDSAWATPGVRSVVDNMTVGV